MKRRSSRVGLRLVALGVTLVLAACSVSEPPPDEPPGPAPEPTPSGALYGRVMTADGNAVPRATVGIWQAEALDLARGFAALLTLGLTCLFPTGGLCPKEEQISAADDGTFSFPPERMKNSETTVLTATGYSEGLRSVPASTMAVFGDGPDPQRAPDLVLWQPTLQYERTERDLRVTWDAPVPGDNGAVEYSVTVIDPRHRAEPWPVGGPTSEPAVIVDGRALEDTGALLVVVATTTGSASGQEVKFTYSTAGQPVPQDHVPVPMSRGRPCLLDDPARGGALAAVADPCSLTDGDLHQHAEVLLPGECSVATADACSPPASHLRLCVDLGGAASVSLVIVRTPFPGDGFAVTLSSDSHRFSPPQTAPADAAETSAREDFPIRIDPPRNASVVCVERVPSPSVPRELVGAHLSEISIW